MPSPRLNEWQLLCSVWQEVEVFGTSLPTSISENQRALQRYNVRLDRLETTTAIALFQDECKIPQAVGAINATRHIGIIGPSIILTDIIVIVLSCRL